MSGKIFDLTPESVPARRAPSAQEAPAALTFALRASAARTRLHTEVQRAAAEAAWRRERQGLSAPTEDHGGVADLPAALQRQVSPEEWAAAVQSATEERARARVWLARRRAAEAAEAGVLQAQAEVGREGGALSPALSGRIGAKRGGGQPLEATVRQGMEGVFGVSFGHVRIHADPEADLLNRGVAAIAFTVGSDVFFRAGFYQPQTPAGQHLLAHELTHVVQQRTGSLSSGGNAGGGTMTVGAADDQHEQEAEQTAHRVVAALQARGQALSAPATSPGAALSRVHDPETALAPAAPGIARAAAPSWPAPPVNKTGLVPLAVPCPGAIVAGSGVSLPLAAPVLAAARVIPQPLPVGAPVLLLGHDGAVGGSGWSYVRLLAPPWAGREGWLSSTAVRLAPAAPAPPRAVAPRRVPAPAVVFNDGGVHLYAQPSTAPTQAPLLPWNTTLTVDAYLPPDAAHRDQAGWCHVTTPGGQRGYVNSGYLDYDLPDPQAKLLKIQAHDTAEIIVKKAGYRFAHGRDARYYVNVLVSVNKPGTLYNHDPHPEQVDHWKKTVAVKDETIWLPGQAFADSLTGVVGSGSITGGAWAALQQGLGWAEVHVLQTAALANQALGIVGDAATNAAHYALTVGGRVIARIPRAVGPAAVAALQAVATLGTQPAALIVALGKAVAGAVLHQLPPPLVALLEQKAQELIMGVLGPDVRRVLGDARATLALILANPVAFLTHLGQALARGFGQFRDHLWPDLQSGVVTWLARQLGLDAPDGTGFTLDATGLLSLGLDALGLTYAAFRGKVVDRLTAEKVGQADLLVRGIEAGVQGVPALLTTLKRQGLAATWRTLLARVGASMDSLLPAALGAVRDWVAQRLVQQGIVRLVALCNPVGDIIEALLAAYNALQFVADNLRHIGQLVETLSGALGRIARGDTGPAGDTIYAGLKQAVPLLLDFVARQVGLTGVGAAIGQALARVKAFIAGIEAKVVGLIAAEVKRLAPLLHLPGHSSSPGGAHAPGAPSTGLTLQQQLDHVMAAALHALAKYNGKRERESDLQPTLDSVKQSTPYSGYKIQALKPVPHGEHWAIYGKINPDETKETNILVAGTPTTALPQVGMTGSITFTSREVGQAAINRLTEITSPSQVNAACVELAKSEPDILNRYKQGYIDYVHTRAIGQTFELPLTYLKNRASRKQGKEGEAQWIAAAIPGATKNSKVFSVEGTSRNWIPDIFTDEYVGDAKDEAYKSFTEQLQAFYIIAKLRKFDPEGRVIPREVRDLSRGVKVTKERKFIVLVRKGGHVSVPLREAADRIDDTITY